MGIYVELIRLDGLEGDYVSYNYQFSIIARQYKNKAGKLRNELKLVVGVIQIEKLTGESEIIELAEGDNGAYAQRAMLALRRDWKKSEFPDKTCWAS